VKFSGIEALVAHALEDQIAASLLEPALRTRGLARCVVGGKSRPRLFELLGGGGPKDPHGASLCRNRENAFRVLTLQIPPATEKLVREGLA